MTELIIKIDIIPAISIIFTISASLVSIAWFASGKFSKIETFMEGLNTRLTNMEGKTAGAFVTKSPIALTDKGGKLLAESGLKEYIDDNKDSLLTSCGVLSLNNAYDIQNAVFNTFDKITFDIEMDKKLKEYAFSQGVGIDIIRRVGAIYFRDICLEHKKLELKDLDKQ